MCQHTPLNQHNAAQEQAAFERLLRAKGKVVDNATGGTNGKHDKN